MAKIFSSAIIGLQAQIIEVELGQTDGLRSFNIVGMAAKSVEEAKERVDLAIQNSGFKSPTEQNKKYIVNLAPAEIKKEGALFDLPIALSYLLTSGQIAFNPNNKLISGELSLNGELRPIKGALVIASEAKAKGFTELFLPKINAPEAALVPGIKIFGFKNLKEVVCHLEGIHTLTPENGGGQLKIPTRPNSVNIGWVQGQEYAKRALEIAAAGGHNLLMEGPPGTGKTLLAKSLTGLLPPLTPEESLEVTKIYSIAGLLPPDSPLIKEPPFRSPHHTASEAALLGGGSPPQPGEITLAHRGVLFLDELPEFHRDVLESLRQPLEEGEIHIMRANLKIKMPAQFILVAAANPCPCGYYGDPDKACSCSSSQIQMYRRKLSGPLMDRIDMFITVPRLSFDKLAGEENKTLEQEIQNRIKEAREIQSQRFQDSLLIKNSEMQIPEIKKYCYFDEPSQNLLKQAVDSGKLSPRAYHRVLKVARTIADLAHSEKILFEHISEALMYRRKEN